MLMSDKLAKGQTTARAPGPVLMGPVDVGTFSLSLTVIGEGYRMYGYIGMAVYALIFGFLASNWDFIGQRRFLTTKLYFILNVAWLFAFLWGFRSGFALVTGLYPVMGAYVLCLIAGASGLPFVAHNLVPLRPRSVRQQRQIVQQQLAKTPSALTDNATVSRGSVLQ